MNCKHLNRIGDNYGESCRDCGAQLSGYGWGGFFGSRLTDKETCIHLYAPMGEPGSQVICVYCERLKPVCLECGAPVTRPDVNLCDSCLAKRIEEYADRASKRASEAFHDWNAGERPEGGY